MTDLEKVVAELRDVLKQIFGILLDARQDFPSRDDHDRDGPGRTSWKSAPWLHSTTQGELKRRNLPGGPNDVFIGNMCLVGLYTYWEDHYRAKVAAARAV